MIVSVLTALATSIGMAQALALLDQTRRLRRAGSAQEVSVAFLSASLIGNVVWFAYGTFRLDAALLVVNSAGLLGGTATLVTALRLRRSRPRIPTARSNPLAVVGSRGQQAQPTRAAQRAQRALAAQRAQPAPTQVPPAAHRDVVRRRRVGVVPVIRDVRRPAMRVHSPATTRPAPVRRVVGDEASTTNLCEKRIRPSTVRLTRGTHGRAPAACGTWGTAEAAEAAA